MPVQKGKKKTKRERRRLGMLGDPEYDEDESVEVVPRKRVSAPVTKRKGFQAPLWLNATIGLVMFFFGLFYYLTNIHNGKMSSNESFLLLLAYMAVAAFYIARAVRQYLAKRGSQ